MKDVNAKNARNIRVKSITVKNKELKTSNYVLPIATFALLHQVYDSSTTDATGQARWPGRLSYWRTSFPDYTSSIHRGDQSRHRRSREERLRGRKCPISCIRDLQTRTHELFLPTEELPANKYLDLIQSRCKSRIIQRLPVMLVIIDQNHI